MNKLIVISFVFVNSILMGCNGSTSGKNAESELPNKIVYNLLQPLNIVAINNAAELIDAAGARMYGQIALERSSENIIISPLANTLSLAILYEGSGGKTEEQLGSFLNWGSDKAILSQSLSDFVNAQIVQANKVEDINLSVNNMAWVQSGLGLSAQYLNTMKDQYKFQLKALDFENDSVNSLDVINAWGREASRNLLQEILPSGSIDENTRIVQSTLIYFSAKWQKPFSINDTGEESFFVSQNKTLQVPIMYQVDDFNYVQTQEWDAVELDYVNQEFSMLLILPSKDMFETVEGNLSALFIEDVVNQLKSGYITLGVPKFNIKTNLDLGGVLTSLGLSSLFNSQDANFDGMFVTANNYYVSRMNQAANISVNELGTEVAVAVTSNISVVSEPEAFINFNRPFIFAIRDKLAGVTLFLGRVMNPSN